MAEKVMKSHEIWLVMETVNHVVIIRCAVVISFFSLQPEIHPGQCWALKGSHGYLVIQLSGWVKPTSFSVEHIDRRLSPTGKIESAPKEFQVYVRREDYKCAFFSLVQG